MTTRMFSIGQLLVVGALCGASIFVACGGEESSTDGTAADAGSAGLSATGLGGRANFGTGGRLVGGTAGALGNTGGRTGSVGGSNSGGRFGAGGGAVIGIGGVPGSTCVGGVNTGDFCDAAIDSADCVRTNRTCACDAAMDEWVCTPNATGVGGGVGAGGSGSTTDCGNGVRDGQDCTNGEDADCTIAAGRNAGSSCSCGTDDQWACTEPGGAGGAIGVGGGNTGFGGATGSTCVGGIQTDSECNPAVDTEVCVRSNRTCTCGADSAVWTCVSIDGAGGGTGVGGGVGAGGSGSTTDCGNGVRDGQDCTNGEDTDCTLANGPNAGNTCTCNADDQWACSDAAGVGGVTGAGGDTGVGGVTGVGGDTGVGGVTGVGGDTAGGAAGATAGGAAGATAGGAAGATAGGAAGATAGGAAGATAGGAAGAAGAGGTGGAAVLPLCEATTVTGGECSTSAATPDADCSVSGNNTGDSCTCIPQADWLCEVTLCADDVEEAAPCVNGTDAVCTLTGGRQDCTCGTDNTWACDNR